MASVSFRGVPSASAAFHLFAQAVVSRNPLIYRPGSQEEDSEKLKARHVKPTPKMEETSAEYAKVWLPSASAGIRRLPSFCPGGGFV